LLIHSVLLPSTATNANDESAWDLNESDKGNLPASDEAWERKYEEWQQRDWMAWLSEHLTFPFTVTREEDEDDAYFQEGAARAPFRLGHTMKIKRLVEDDVDMGIIVQVTEKGKTGEVPLGDLKVKPKTDKNYWPVREYVVWFANRCV
jgi:hypothetical protein